MKKETSNKKKMRLLKVLVICAITAAAFLSPVSASEADSFGTMSLKDSEKLVDVCIAYQIKKSRYKLSDEDYKNVDFLIVDGYIEKPLYTTRFNEMMNDVALDLRALVKLENLRTLEIRNVSINNFSPLAEIKSLKELSICNVKGSPKAPDTDNNIRTQNAAEAIPVSFKTLKKVDGLENAIGELKNLNWLTITGLNVNNIDFLQKLTKLEYLEVLNMNVSDISPMKGLVNLQTLKLFMAKVTDISPLASLKELRHLNLENTQLSDVEPLRNLTKLEYLDLRATKITSIEPLKNLVNLKYLDICSTRVKDLGPLSKLKNLEMLKVLSGFGFILSVELKELQKALPNLEINSSGLYFEKRNEN